MVGHPAQIGVEGVAEDEEAQDPGEGEYPPLVVNPVPLVLDFGQLRLGLGDQLFPKIAQFGRGFLELLFQPFQLLVDEVGG